MAHGIGAIKGLTPFAERFREEGFVAIAFDYRNFGGRRHRTVPAALEVARRAPRAELFRSAGGHYDVYEGGAGFADVLRTEVDFLHRHAKTAAKRGQ